MAQTEEQKRRIRERQAQNRAVRQGTSIVTPIQRANANAGRRRLADRLGGNLAQRSEQIDTRAAAQRNVEAINRGERPVVSLPRSGQIPEQPKPLVSEPVPGVQDTSGIRGLRQQQAATDLLGIPAKDVASTRDIENQVRSRVQELENQLRGVTDPDARKAIQQQLTTLNQADFAESTLLQAALNDPDSLARSPFAHLPEFQRALNQAQRIRETDMTQAEADAVATVERLQKDVDAKFDKEAQRIANENALTEFNASIAETVRGTSRGTIGQLRKLQREGVMARRIELLQRQRQAERAVAKAKAEGLSEVRINALQASLNAISNARRTADDEFNAFAQEALQAQADAQAQVAESSQKALENFAANVQQFGTDFLDQQNPEQLAQLEAQTGLRPGGARQLAETLSSIEARPLVQQVLGTFEDPITGDLVSAALMKDGSVQKTNLGMLQKPRPQISITDQIKLRKEGLQTDARGNIIPGTGRTGISAFAPKGVTVQDIIGEFVPTNEWEEAAVNIMDPLSRSNIDDYSVKDKKKILPVLRRLQQKAMDRGDIIGVIRASAGGKDADQAFKKAIKKSGLVIQQLNTLKDTIDKVNGQIDSEGNVLTGGGGFFGSGPLIGRLLKLNPYDEEAQAVQAQLVQITPNLARGVFGEVGVLTDTDIKLYQRALPNLTQPEDVQDAVTALTLRTVRNSIENEIEVEAGNGVDVSGMERVYSALDAEIRDLESKVGLGEATTAGPPEEGEPQIVEFDGEVTDETARQFLESQRLPATKANIEEFKRQANQ